MPMNFALAVGCQGCGGIGDVAEDELRDVGGRAVVFFEGVEGHAGDLTVFGDHAVEAVGAAADGLHIKGRIGDVGGVDAFEGMLGQDAEGQVVHKGRERLGQAELDGLFVEGGDLDFFPELAQVGGQGAVIGAQQVEGEDDIFTGDGLPVVEDGVLADGEVVDGAVLRDAPGFGEVANGQAAVVELN